MAAQAFGELVGAVGKLGTDFDKTPVYDCRELTLAAGEGLGNLAGALDQSLIDLPGPVIESLGNTVGIAFEGIGDAVDTRADGFAEIGQAGRQRSLHRLRLAADRGDQFRAAFADKFIDLNQPVFEFAGELSALLIELRTATFDNAGDLRTRCNDFLVDRQRPAFDRIGNFGAGGDNPVVDRQAPVLDAVGDFGAGGDDPLVDR